MCDVVPFTCHDVKCCDPTSSADQGPNLKFADLSNNKSDSFNKGSIHHQVLLEETKPEKRPFYKVKSQDKSRKSESVETEKAEERPRVSTTVDGVVKKRRGRPLGCVKQPHWKKPGRKSAKIAKQRPDLRRNRIA